MKRVVIIVVLLTLVLGCQKDDKSTFQPDFIINDFYGKETVFILSSHYNCSILSQL